MDKFLEFLSGFNIQTIISMVAIFWWFSRDLKSEMIRLENKIDQQSSRIDQQGARTDRLYEMFIDLLKETKKN